ncbi:ABC transporter ATP-binding protein [Entomoplasma ellychniae]|uniref:ABC transporter ATP-binding protein n=1 Tax=Entomoplasma ellychniae TaxID=2114 RepID=A0A8E2UCJ9_9MOLU|nr:ABC transporter ATP-binding protein [Entomoplasma ellychniae]PPE04472.1 ABC transporter ATP-binding protein [Entomoplasma ellychniae]
MIKKSKKASDNTIISKTELERIQLEIDNEKEQAKINKTINKEDSFSSLVKRYFKKEWRLGIVIVMLAIISVGCSVMIPLLTRQMTIDISIKNAIANNAEASQISLLEKEWWGFSWDHILYIALSVVGFSSIAQFFSNYFSFIFSKRVEIDLRNKTLEALVRQDISYYSDKQIGEIITGVISDTQIVGDQLAQVPVTLFTAFLTIVGASAMMLYFEWTLATSVLVTFVVVLMILLVMFGFMKNSISRVRKVLTTINGKVTDRISNIRLIKASGTENYEKEFFQKKHKGYYEQITKLAKVQSSAITVLFSGISLIQFVAIATAMIKYGSTPGPESTLFFSTVFASFSLAQGIMVGPLFQVVMSAVGVASASVSAQRIATTVNAKSIMDPHYNDGIIVKNVDGDIHFKKVSFAYPEKPEKQILPEFDFTFKKGKSYAFVGETGSGKSTISRLLLRFYDPTTGDVLINGNTNLKDVNLSSYLDNVGYVEQDPQILYGDIYENVKYGRFNASDKQVVEACKKAELDELIMSWPDGYKTILGERGFMLSGGQKQRLIIARMFLKDPQLLILDEATSALDNIVEKEIQEKLEALMVGRTTVSIAHRLSTIKNSDQIIVLGKDGKGIVQIGTFDELKTKKGHFKELYEAGLMD